MTTFNTMVQPSARRTKRKGDKRTIFPSPSAIVLFVIVSCLEFVNYCESQQTEITAPIESESAIPSNVTTKTGTENEPDASSYIMRHLTLFLITMHVSVFVTGLIGNALVCLSVHRNKELQTVTNCYIVNLAIADFLVILICLPPTVYWDLNLTWNFGRMPCKLIVYLQVSRLMLNQRAPCVWMYVFSRVVSCAIILLPSFRPDIVPCVWLRFIAMM